jgi:hypothetical protein
LAPEVIDLPEDFRDLLVELHDAGAEFVIVGGYAVAFHGYPRATKDIDILVRAVPENAARVYRALAAFGAPLSTFEVSEVPVIGLQALLKNKRATGRKREADDVTELERVERR